MDSLFAFIVKPYARRGQNVTNQTPDSEARSVRQRGGRVGGSAGVASFSWFSLGCAPFHMLARRCHRSGKTLMVVRRRCLADWKFIRHHVLWTTHELNKIRSARLTPQINLLFHRDQAPST